MSYLELGESETTDYIVVPGPWKQDLISQTLFFGGETRLSPYHSLLCLGNNLLSSVYILLHVVSTYT